MLFRGVDPTMAMLAMTILVHFWVLYGAIVPSTHHKVQTCGNTLQPSQPGAFYIPILEASQQPAA